MKCQVFTVAKLHYVNGVVHFVAREGPRSLETLAQHSANITKSGKPEHPFLRVRTLVRLAEGIGLLHRIGRTEVEVTELGRRYARARTQETWSLSAEQKELLREHIPSDPSCC
jgi:hypothetical protein